ncbi:MAG: NAD(+)/NADH kinase [Ilumatobacteraceae bacterium]
MIRVAIVPHRTRDDAHELAVATIRWLAEQGHEGWVPSGDAVGDELASVASDRPLADADLILSLGGDGTMLHSVHQLDGAAVPLLGVNLGRLGYLTEVEVDEVRTALERFDRGADDGSWTLDERMMLDVEAIDADGISVGSWRALNEGVVEKQDSGHTVHLLVRIDGEPFTSYAADGLIVSTPTGSTAYSLSARGPVVSPKHRALLVTPVAPHMLFDRSLVLDPSETVDIEVLDGHTASVAIDGRAACSLGGGAKVTCRPSTATACFVRFGEHHYHQVLKAKFGLHDR